MSSTTTTGSAGRWGPLWGARPDDWALSEDQQGPTYEAALARVPLGPGDHVLDIGCGAGAFLRLAAARGARTTGLDASQALLDLAARRVPDAVLHLGDMEALPFGDDAFDVVTGFNTFFFADDMVAALREAGRVARSGAPVVIGVWGPHEDNDLEAMKTVLRPHLPPRPADAPPEPDLARPGVLEGLAAAAGLLPREAHDSTWSYVFADETVLRRALVAPAGLAALVGPEQEDEVKDAIVAGLERHRTADGGFRLRNTFHTLIAMAP